MALYGSLWLCQGYVSLFLWFSGSSPILMGLWLCVAQGSVILSSFSEPEPLKGEPEVLILKHKL